MKIRAVAQIRKHVFFSRERRLPDPCHAFRAHVGKRRRFTIHPQHHVMATDTGQRTTAFRYLGRCVVRAAGAEMGNAVLVRIRFRTMRLQHVFLCFQKSNALLHALLDRMASKVFRNARSDRARDLGRTQFVGCRQQPVAVTFARVAAPFAGIIELADHARTNVVAPVVQLFLDLVFENLALFLDHDDFVQPLRECMHAFRFERPRHADLVQTDADVFRDGFVDAEIGQCLARIEIGLACSDDADACMRAVPYDLVQFVRTHIRKRRIPFEIVHPRFLIKHGIGLANVQTARWQFEFGRDHDLHPLRVDVDRCTGFDNIGHAFHRHPQAGVATHRPRMQTVIEIFLHAGRKQHRNATRFQNVFALMRSGR